MVRVKKAVNALKYRRNLLRQAKGYRFDRSKKERAAQEAIMKAGAYSFAHRRDKKGDFRSLFILKINAALREGGLTYSKFMGTLKRKNVIIDRKILATLAEFHPEIFKKVVSQTK